MNKFKEALNQASHAIDLDPNNGAALIEKGIALNEYDEHDEAIKCLNAGLKLYPDFPDPWPFTARASIFTQRKQWDAAIKDATVGVKYRPKQAFRYKFRGEIYATAGLMHEAERDYSTAIQLDPHHPEAYCARARLFLQQHQYEKAISDYNKVIEIDPNTPAYYGARAQLYKKIGKLDLAEKDLKRTNQGYDEMMPSN